ncbi:MAG: MATE family efflux transporter [Bacteroidales bacterium]|nr:MATE family efflux transporter [Bacteroidales bacterium]MBR5862737.1 MATE family efflux transporter [Bacteroidales bacterium]
MKPINKDILKLAIPSILANITVPLVGMVDIAVAGHLDVNAATMIGGIAIGSMLFDLLYWNFGFLRVGTGGLAAQAYGRGDRKECARILARALGIALACALVLIAIQWIFVKAAFLVVDSSPEVQTLATKYFFIRIWAAPATLSLMALKGWFIGMQDSVSAMATDMTVNGMNVLMSIILSLGFAVGGLHYDGMGFTGVAAGTVVAQYSGLTVALLLLLWKYRKNTLSTLALPELRGLFKGDETRRFFVMNADLYVRSLCFIAIYIGFTIISARYGDVLLAVSSILMKLLMIFSYFTDGFAYAGEALVGKYIGARDRGMLSQSIRWIFVWSMGLALLFMGVYHFAGMPLLRMMTSDASVIEASIAFLPWLLLMPPVGCAAFTWDGIFIGATASKGLRNSMFWAVVAFVSVWVIGILCLTIMVERQTVAPDQCDGLAMHVLMAAYFAHLLARTVYLTAKARKSVLSAI